MTQILRTHALGVSTLALAAALGSAQAGAQSATTKQPELPPVVITQGKPKPVVKPIAKPVKPAPAVAEPAPQPVKAAKASKPKVAQSKPKPPAQSKPKPPAQPPESYEPAPAATDDVVVPSGDPGVGATGLAVPATTTVINGGTLSEQTPATNNTAAIASKAPGVSIYQGGQVSGLPAINGLNDDRVRVLLNGMVVSSACANHMNPPLSYADPAQVASIEVLAGVTPVSKGGDSLGGTIIVESAPARFAPAGSSGIESHGSISGIYRSNGDGVATAATAEVATSALSLSYAGAWSKADNYEDGRGRDVKSTEYEAQNHAVKLSIRNGGDLFIVQGGLQFIPYQGFVNQRMDMIDNEAWFLNTRYVGTFGWGKLDARAFHQNTQHQMNFLDDKKFNHAMMVRNMPMLTDGSDTGYSVKAEIPLSQSDVLRIGNEFHHQELDDWWPATMASSMMMPFPMMGPNTYITLNDATRDRVGTFIEWERKWDAAWTTLIGARNDTVWMDTGNVAGYNGGPVYGPDAVSFNSKDHSKTDVNFDATALTRFEPDRTSLFELGYAMKSRAPNLYERYAWSRPPAQMAMNMIGWFGDGNGYTGNLNLQSETAHTVSLTMDWHDPGRHDWSFKVTPYYTYVQNYIGVRKLQDSIGHPGFVDLEFANHDAELYGVNISGAMPLGATQFGRFALTGVAGYVHGENADTGVSLYHMMPFHGRIALTHLLGGWSSAVELDLVGGKHNVDTVRNELQTAGYALVNLRTSYELQNVRFDLGVENLFDTYYEHPLGGHDIEPTMPGHIGGVGPKDNVPGQGRSLYAGVTVRF